MFTGGSGDHNRAALINFSMNDYQIIECTPGLLINYESGPGLSIAYCWPCCVKLFVMSLILE